MNLLTEQHEPGNECYGLHCWEHHVDEASRPGDYIACGECGHIYRTAGELRRAYRREILRVHSWEGDRWLIPDRGPFGGPTRLQKLIAALTIRASKIYFCQHCIHDF